jgi:hypothetical protein
MLDLIRDTCVCNFGGAPFRQRSLLRSKQICWDNIKMDLRGVRYGNGRPVARFVDTGVMAFINKHGWNYFHDLFPK